MPDDDKNTAPPESVAKTWGLWLLLFVPGFAVAVIAADRFGLNNVLPVLVGLLIIVLLYQRFVRKRTWNAIIWGRSASRD